MIFAWDAGRVTDDPASVLDAALRSEAPSVKPRLESVVESIRSIDGYVCESETVGPAAEMAVVAHTRRAGLRRVAAAIGRARPHIRSRLVELGAHARRAIMGRMNAAAESELARMALLEIPDEEWLSAVAGYGTLDHPKSIPDSGGAASHDRIIALLLLQRDT